MGKNVIYVVGHKNPDTDSVCSAILFANMMNKVGMKEEYIPATLGDINRETSWILREWGLKPPENILNKKVNKVFLVDHNEKSQSIDCECEITGICDHHSLNNFSYHKVIPITISPLGSTASIIYSTMDSLEYQKTKTDKGLTLSAILSDTLGLASSTTTLTDRIIARTLSQQLAIDLDNYFIKMFQQSSVSDLSSKEIFHSDIKTYVEADESFTIGQALVTTGTEEEEIERKIKTFITAKSIKKNFFMITNIFTRETLLLTTINNETVLNEFNTKIQKSGILCSVRLFNKMSRKKDVLPVIRRYYADNTKKNKE